MPDSAVKCPNCSANATLVQTIDEVPHFGKLMFSVLKCASCGFKLSDVMSLDFKKPCEHSAKVSKPSELSIKIVKSSTGTVRIPELGVEIEPGPASEGYFTNLEGLLDRVEMVSQILVNSAKLPAEVKAAAASLKKVQAAKAGELKFSVKVLDPFGNSALIGNGVKKKFLTKEQAAKLKKPMTVFESA